MSKDNGGPAFPHEGGNKFMSGNEIRKTLPSSGMTLRDYFAAKAMPQLMAFHGERLGWEHNNIAAEAYHIADAMLAARNT
ncbi:hypothetical protein JQR85_13685 [Stutzerimonas urumqiensis]|uniref:hypothetical protein n=1 Tax=Stutzerimonas urumqiensis TaxID=638269 RepID=UPI003DA35877